MHHYLLISSLDHGIFWYYPFQLKWTRRKCPRTSSIFLYFDIFIFVQFFLDIIHKRTKESFRLWSISSCLNESFLRMLEIFNTYWNKKWIMIDEILRLYQSMSIAYWKRSIDRRCWTNMIDRRCFRWERLRRKTIFDRNINESLQLNSVRISMLLLRLLPSIGNWPNWKDYEWENDMRRSGMRQMPDFTNFIRFSCEMIHHFRTLDEQSRKMSTSIRENLSQQSKVFLTNTCVRLVDLRSQWKPRISTFLVVRRFLFIQ